MNAMCSCSIRPPMQYVAHCRTHQIEILRSAAAGPVYEDILGVRSSVYCRCRREVAQSLDDYSELYCAYVAGIPCGTLRVTHAVRGSLDCEECFPSTLLSEYRHQLSSASAFCVFNSVDSNLKLARLLIETAWVDGLPKGIRLDVINAAERGIPYYLRMGYSLIEGSFFIHPRLKTRSHALIFCADPNAGTPLDHLFNGLSNPVTRHDLAPVVTLTRERPMRRRSRSVVAV